MKETIRKLDDDHKPWTKIPYHIILEILSYLRVRIRYSSYSDINAIRLIFGRFSFDKTKKVLRLFRCFNIYIVEQNPTFIVDPLLFLRETYSITLRCLRFGEYYGQYIPTVDVWLLDSVKHFKIVGANITNMRHVKLKNVESMKFYWCENVGQLFTGFTERLTTLILKSVSITDEDLVHLGGVDILSLRCSDITGAGLRYLKKVRILDLSKIIMDEVFYKYVSHVETIILDEVPITDFGVKYFTGCRQVVLNGSRITDFGLRVLSNVECLHLGKSDKLTIHNIGILKGVKKLSIRFKIFRIEDLTPFKSLKLDILSIPSISERTLKYLNLRMSLNIKKICLQQDKWEQLKGLNTTNLNDFVKCINFQKDHNGVLRHFDFMC